jgi:hypothetical protein
MKKPANRGSNPCGPIFYLFLIERIDTPIMHARIEITTPINALLLSKGLAIKI